MGQIDGAATDHLFYSAYLVRLWQDGPGVACRASVQSVQSGEITRFGSLAALFAFLQAETAAGAEATAPPAGSDAASPG